jgi:hypothetical protein
MKALMGATDVVEGWEVGVGVQAAKWKWVGEDATKTIETMVTMAKLQ